MYNLQVFPVYRGRLLTVALVNDMSLPAIAPSQTSTRLTVVISLLPSVTHYLVALSPFLVCQAGDPKEFLPFKPPSLKFVGNWRHLLDKFEHLK